MLRLKQETGLDQENLYLTKSTKGHGKSVESNTVYKFTKIQEVDACHATIKKDVRRAMKLRGKQEADFARRRLGFVKFYPIF